MSNNARISRVADKGLDALTMREHQVLLYVAKGFSDKEIGELLQVSRHTINSHLRCIFSALGASTRVEAAVIAAKAGLV